MFDKIKDFLSRVRVRLAPLVGALIAALPVLLDQLGVIDLKPILSRVVSPEYASVLVGLLPFVLAFLRPLVHLADAEEK